jgi:hypothetical protein
MRILLLFGPPVGNDRMIMIAVIAFFAFLWLLSVASKWITEKVWKGKAKMQNTADELRALVEHATSRFESISEEESSVRPSGGKWSKKEILGHLIDSATNNHQRFVRGQLGAEIKLPGYEQEAWVRSQAYQAESWMTLIQFWRFYNLHLIHLMENLSHDKLATTCFIGDNPPVTLEFIITDYVRHLRHHLEQIYS